MTYARRTRIVFVYDFCPTIRIYSEVQKGSIGTVVSRKKNGWMRVRVDNTHEIVCLRNSGGIAKLEKESDWKDWQKDEARRIAHEMLLTAKNLEYIANSIKKQVTFNSCISSSSAQYVADQEFLAKWRSQFAKLPIMGKKDNSVVDQVTNVKKLVCKVLTDVQLAGMRAD